MKISHPFFLAASLGTAMALVTAPSSHANAVDIASSAEKAQIKSPIESPPETVEDLVVVPIVAKTVLPSKVRPGLGLSVIAQVSQKQASELPVSEKSVAMTAQKPEPIRTTAPTVAIPSLSTPAATPVVPAAQPPIIPPKPSATPLPPNNPAPIVPTTPVPGSSSIPATTSPTATTPTGDPRTAIPEYLNPDANPLLFPTKPEEVALKGVQPISLKEAIELVERNNRTLEQTKLQLERSKASLREAQADLFPSIFVQGDLSRSKSASTELSRRAQLNRQVGSFGQTISRAEALDNLKDADDAQTTLNFTGQISYEIFNSGRRKSTIKAAERQVRLSELEVERVLEQARFDVSNDYYDLQDADEQVITNTAAVSSAQSNLKDAQAQFEAGLGTRFDVLRAQVQVANNQQQLTSAIATRDVRRRQLAQRLSLRESVGVRASDPVAVAGTWNWSLEDTIVRAYKSRAELEQQLVQREISEQRRKAALSALGPTVTLNAQANLLDVFEDSLGVAFGSGYTFSAQARWQLFDGGAARARASQQEKDKQIAESRFAEVRNTVRFEVERAYTTLLANQASIQTTEAAVTQAEEALRLAILRFQAGVGTQTDRINAEADLTRARGNKTSAIIGYNRSLAQLKRAVSNLAQSVR